MEAKLALLVARLLSRCEVDWLVFQREVKSCLMFDIVVYTNSMTNIQTLTESLAKKRLELDKLQADLESAREKQFTSLPGKVGLQTIDELIKALVPFASPRLKGMFNGAASGKPTKRAASSSGATKKTRKRKRAKITPELRAKVIAAVKAGGKTGEAIADELGISMPSVANIKKAAGLTKKRAGR